MFQIILEDFKNSERTMVCGPLEFVAVGIEPGDGLTKTSVLVSTEAFENADDG
jgi:hypothetical protein